MTHHDVVLVGVDGSPASLEAADWAAAYAHAHGRALHLVCAYSVPSFTAAALDRGYAALDDTAIAEGARAVLDAAVARVRATGVRPPSPACRSAPGPATSPGCPRRWTTRPCCTMSRRAWTSWWTGR